MKQGPRLGSARPLFVKNAENPNSVTGARNKSELLATIKNIVDLNEYFAIIFDVANVAVILIEINLNRNFGRHVVHEMSIVEDHLAV
jgi:hypothetical protein